MTIKPRSTLKNSMADEGVVRLPFPAFTANIINGNPEKADLKSAGDARYFGGFKFSEDKNASEISPDNALPAGYNLVDVWSKEKGETYRAYVGRCLYVAPITRRFGWFHNERKKYGSSAVQILCYMGNKTESGLVACGLVILSAGSYAGQALDATFRRFELATCKQRADIGGIDANYFWRKIGTMGQDIQQVEKGKIEKSPITPIYLYGDDPNNKTPLDKLTDLYTQAVLEKTYVGDSLADKMDSVFPKCTEWLEDWKNKAGDKEQHDRADIASAVKHADPVTGEIDPFYL
jgi:hypothetical protein